MDTLFNKQKNALRDANASFEDMNELDEVIKNVVANANNMVTFVARQIIAKNIAVDRLEKKCADDCL